jgi:hypothetical protein
MIPPSDRYRRAFDEALSHELASIDLTDEAAARAAVGEAVKAAQAAAAQAALDAVLVEARARVREEEQAKRRAETDAKRRAEIERDGAKALRKVFGKVAASVTSVFRDYTIATLHDVTVALPADQLDDFRDRLMRELGTRPEEGKTAPAYQLAKIIDDPADLAAIVTDADEAFELVRAAHTEALERAQADRQRRNAENAAIRAAADERRLYGTTIDG